MCVSDGQRSDISMVGGEFSNSQGGIGRIGIYRLIWNPAIVALLIKRLKLHLRVKFEKAVNACSSFIETKFMRSSNHFEISGFQIWHPGERFDRN